MTEKNNNLNNIVIFNNEILTELIENKSIIIVLEYI